MADVTEKPKVFKMAGAWVWTCCEAKVGRTFSRPTGAWDCAVVTALDHHEHYHSPDPGEEINPLGESEVDDQ